MTAAELYNDQIKRLPVAERLRLASLILNDIPPESVVDAGEEWADKDLREFGQASLGGEGQPRAPRTVERRPGVTIFGPEEGTGTAEDILRAGVLGGWAHRTDITDGRQFVDELRARRRERRAAE